MYFAKGDDNRLCARKYKQELLHYFCSECALPVSHQPARLKKQAQSKECPCEQFEALKLGDIIPGKGRNRYSNFILHLAGFEALKTKSRAQMEKEQNNIDNKTLPSAIGEEVEAP